MPAWEDADDTIADARDGPTDDDRPSGGGDDPSDSGAGPPEDDNDDRPSEENVDAVTPSPNPGLPSTEEPDDPGGPPEDDGGDAPSGPPEDDKEPQQDFPDPNRTPPSERPETGVPDRDGRPPDSGEEGRRVDEVTPSDDPGIDEPTDRADDQEDFPRPDRRSPTQRRRQEQIAEQTPGVTEEDVSNVRRVETDDGRDRLVADRSGTAQEQAARERFRERRRAARREADVDRVSRLGAYETDEIVFEETDSGVRVAPSEPAADRRQEVVATQRIQARSPQDVDDEDVVEREDGGFGLSDEAQEEQFRQEAAEELDVSEDRINIERDGDELQASVEPQSVPERFGVDPNREPGRVASVIGEAAGTFRESRPIIDVGIERAADSFRDGEFGEATDEAVESLEPAATSFDEGVMRGAEAAAGTTTAAGGTISETFARSGARGAQYLNPVRTAQDIARAPEITVRGVDLATDEDAASNLQTAGDVGAAAGEVVIEEGPEYVRENPGTAAEVTIGAAGAAATSVIGGTGALRGARAAGRRAARLRRTDTDVDQPIGTRSDIRESPGTLLREEDIPTSTQTRGTDVGTDDSRIRAFLEDERGQLDGGLRQRQRQRPEDPEPEPTRDPLDRSDREIVEGSPRDRISGDITRRAQERRRQAEGSFEGDTDPLARRQAREGVLGSGRQFGARRADDVASATSSRLGALPISAGLLAERSAPRTTTGTRAGLGVERNVRGVTDQDVGQALDSLQGTDQAIGQDTTTTPTGRTTTTTTVTGIPTSPTITPTRTPPTRNPPVRDPPVRTPEFELPDSEQSDGSDGVGLRTDDEVFESGIGDIDDILEGFDVDGGGTPL